MSWGLKLAVVALVILSGLFWGMIVYMVVHLAEKYW